MAYEEILLLSADARANFQVRRICEHARIEVTEVTSTALALTALKTVSPHLLFVHLELPRQEIRHFLQRKKSVFTLTDVPFVLMGFPETLKEVQPGEFGPEPPAGWIPLPLDQKSVLAMIRRILRERKPVSHASTGLVLEAVLPGQLSAASEGGVLLRSKVRFEPGAELNGILESEFLSGAGVDESLWVAGGHEPLGDEHETRVSFLGVTRAMAERMRKALGRR